MWALVSTLWKNGLVPAVRCVQQAPCLCIFVSLQRWSLPASLACVWFQLGIFILLLNHSARRKEALLKQGLAHVQRSKAPSFSRTLTASVSLQCSAREEVAGRLLRIVAGVLKHEAGARKPPGILLNRQHLPGLLHWTKPQSLVFPDDSRTNIFNSISFYSEWRIWQSVLSWTLLGIFTDFTKVWNIPIYKSHGLGGKGRYVSFCPHRISLLFLHQLGQLAGNWLYVKRKASEKRLRV